MITQKQAEELVYEQINRRDPAWPDKPEMIIVRVDEHELGWLIFWDSRLHHETVEFRDTVLGNAPYLVSREDGAIFATGTAPPLEERVREAEFKLRTHLREGQQ
ncbi:MAG: YrhB domain-containing protein [Nitrospira sp.]|nr:YrhB domain-containing protein [Nitrospira sp.]